MMKIMENEAKDFIMFSHLLSIGKLSYHEKLLSYQFARILLFLCVCPENLMFLDTLSSKIREINNHFLSLIPPGFQKCIIIYHNGKHWASLVAQWLRICLLMQETRVRALVWEDPTCHGAAGPVSHSC